MAKRISPTSADTDLRRLLDDINEEKIQLPDFQRSWTWDDNRIKGIIASLTQGYPMGALMFLQYGNESVKFKYRPIEGLKEKNIIPEYLVLDGQQRLTSMFRAMFSTEPVDTKTDKGKAISRYYYLDINKCLDDSTDRLDAILSVPSNKKVKINFDRDIILDLSTPEYEYELEMFPINLIFDSNAKEDWADGYKDYHCGSVEYKEKYKRFRNEVLDPIWGYNIPVITLGRDTPREAVCKVFENVNTGGVSLTVFELVTATYATYNFDLRADWEECRDKIWGKNDFLNTDVMRSVDETAFLTSVTLYTTYKSDKATTCKKKDVLDLQFKDYEENRKKLCEGYRLARKFLFNQCVFRKRDLPYATQLIPLAAICAEIGESTFNKPKTEKILSQWFWCGIFGEMYGGANETRYANDMEDVVAAIKGEDVQIRTINAAFFSSTRLLTLQTRLSAAYKGIMALLYKEKCRDFMNGQTMDLAKSMDQTPDIHHIFPEIYCENMKYAKEKWNSIVNKTPLLPASNRSIGGEAPSKYSKKILKEVDISEEEYKVRIESNLINYDDFISDDFNAYFIDRAKRLLKLIEKAMGKSIADKNSEQTINQFGCSLADNI